MLVLSKTDVVCFPPPDTSLSSLTPIDLMSSLSSFTQAFHGACSILDTECVWSIQSIFPCSLIPRDDHHLASPRGKDTTVDIPWQSALKIKARLL